MPEARSRKAPWEDNAHARHAWLLCQTTEATNGSRSFGSAEAVSGVVKRSVPRSSRAEPRLCETPTR